MTKMKEVVMGLSFILIAGTCLAQQEATSFEKKTNDSLIILNTHKNKELYYGSIENYFNIQTSKKGKCFKSIHNASEPGNDLLKRAIFLNTVLNKNKQHNISLRLPSKDKESFFSNRRNVYSSIWAFASLNYIYADLFGVMDKNTLLQYQTGVVNGVKITPKFLAGAAGFMQIPLANVFLPQVIKNERTLRWVQIASGLIMTLVQSGSLFVGKSSLHYVVYSTFEIAATSYITIDAIRWKPKKSMKNTPGF
jgi:hypothetical protein